MNLSYTVYSLAIAWFSYTVFRMIVLLYQFKTFPKTYGSMPKLSLCDLVEMSTSSQKDMPGFKIVIPAYQEVEVIEGTIRRLARMNYPLTHFQVYIATYEDEPVAEGAVSTTNVVQRIAREINAEVSHELIKSVVVPERYNGFFPGKFSAGERHIGKSRGLNYTLRSIHEEIERDERSFYLGQMCKCGGFDRTHGIIQQLIQQIMNMNSVVKLLNQHFCPGSKQYIGSLALSSQLETLISAANLLFAKSNLDKESIGILSRYIMVEAPRFFLDVDFTNKLSEDEIPKLEFCANQEKSFLYEVMKSVEQEDRDQLEEFADNRKNAITQTMPYLSREIAEARDGEEIFQAARKLNSRWLMVYDADADAPADLMRYLAGRILSAPEVMGFQGPVAPVLNYDDVHPLCKLGGLWMAFWHAASYPRLMNNKDWAHPLAGTNWCFRIEGIEQDDTLIRECAYEENKRRFLLSFDPRQLTEDLEAGIRFFNDWSINAEWHPVLELEQVPPTPKGLVVQRTRWTLGTLQTIHYILNSRIPMLQKLRFAVHPIEIMVNGSGPVISISLLVALLSGLLVVEPIFAWWAVILTFGNLVYVISFEAVFERYYGIRQRIITMDYFYQHTASLIREIERNSGTCTTRELALIDKIIRLLKDAQKKNGFAAIYYASRCVDDEVTCLQNGEKAAYYDFLLEKSPTKVHSKDLMNMTLTLQQLQETIRKNQNIPGENILSTSGNALTEDGVLLEQLTEFHDILQYSVKMVKRKWIPRWTKLHKEILIWTFPYIFFQLIPYFKGLYKWLRGERIGWHKTPRTPKRKTGSL